jgi:hypothetical protein
LENQDVRARILQDMYRRKEKGEEILTTPSEYASLLGISETEANFNLEYLLSSGLVKGQAIPSPNSTKKITRVFDMTAHGIEAVEGRYGSNLAINYSSININGPVEGSQIAAGPQVNQSQSVAINEFGELYRYLDTKLDKWQREALKPVLEELKDQVKRHSIKRSTLKRISEIVSKWGPVAYPIVEAVEKLTGMKP